MLIRQAKTADLPLLNTWMAEFLTEALPYAPVDKEHLNKMLVEGIEKSVVLIADDGGILKGTIMGLYMTHPLNPSLTILSEIAWWVPKEWRGGRAGWVLLQAFSSLKRTDLTAVCLMDTSQVAAKHLNKIGYKATEFTFLKDNRC